MWQSPDLGHRDVEGRWWGLRWGLAENHDPVPEFAAQNLVMNVTKDVESDDRACLMFVMDAFEVICIVSVGLESWIMQSHIRSPTSAQP